MKNWILAVVLVMSVAIVGAAAADDVQPGGSTNDGGDARDVPTGKLDAPVLDPDCVVRPVPEPGTMALASMGLIALGAAARKRREKSEK